MDGQVSLRAVEPDDLYRFFEFQNDPVANHMAAFTAADPSDEAAFMAKWRSIVADETKVTRTILVDGAVAGNIAKFDQHGLSEVCYWVDRANWGKGVATEAMTQLLKQVDTRPLYARAVTDNIGSIRVLEKCGFVQTGTDSGFAEGRGEEVAEFVFTLEG